MYMGQAIGYKKEQQGRVCLFRLYQSYGAGRDFTTLH